MEKKNQLYKYETYIRITVSTIKGTVHRVHFLYISMLIDDSYNNRTSIHSSSPKLREKFCAASASAVCSSFASSFILFNFCYIRTTTGHRQLSNIFHPRWWYDGTCCKIDSQRNDAHILTGPRRKLSNWQKLDTPGSNHQKL